jgi:hypothetical protein
LADLPARAAPHRVKAFAGNGKARADESQIAELELGRRLWFAFQPRRCNSAVIRRQP